MTGLLASAAIAGLALTALVVAADGPAAQAVDLDSQPPHGGHAS